MKKIRCPRCRKEATWEGNPFRPFCSERCKLIDLGNWSSGKYVISTPLKPGESGGGLSDDEPDVDD